MGSQSSAFLPDVDSGIVSVLLAEDDPANRFMLRTYLERLGVEVRTAGCGTEALRLLGMQRFDLVVLDIVLPRMDGLEVLRRLRSERHPQRGVPVLVQTGRVSREDVTRFREAGCDEWIAKPYRPDDLMGKVVEMLAARGALIVA